MLSASLGFRDHGTLLGSGPFAGRRLGFFVVWVRWSLDDDDWEESSARWIDRTGNRLRDFISTGVSGQMYLCARRVGDRRVMPRSVSYRGIFVECSRSRGSRELFIDGKRGSTETRSRMNIKHRGLGRRCTSNKLAILFSDDV